jgi:hypothetical protein
MARRARRCSTCVVLIGKKPLSRARSGDVLTTGPTASWPSSIATGARSRGEVAGFERLSQRGSNGIQIGISGTCQHGVHG